MRGSAWKYGVLAASFALSLTAVGCGSDDDGGQDAAASIDGGGTIDATPAVTVADICDQTDGAFVNLFDKALDCLVGFDDLIGAFPDAADLSSFCDGGIAGFIGDGTATLGDYTALEACRAAIAAIDCATFDFDTFTGCDDLIQGTIATGNACENNVQCAGDSFCDTSMGGACGACAPEKANGESCTENSQCINGRCTGASPGNPGTCRTYGQVGSACDSTDDCAGSLLCDGATNKCIADKVWAADDVCTSFDGQCGFPFTNLYCNTNLGMCKAFLAVDAPCSAGQGLCNLPDYEYCDVGGTNNCAAPVLVPNGQPCDIRTGKKCQSGLVCSNPFEGGVCRDPAVGSVCVAGVDDFSCGFLLKCQSDNMCALDGAHTGTCPAP